MPSRHSDLAPPLTLDKSVGSGATGVAAGRKHNSARRREAGAGWLFVAPALVGFLCFVLGPLVAAFWISLTKYDILTPPKFVGMRNYTRMLSDHRLMQSYLNTFLYVAAAVVLMNALALVLALMLNRPFPRPVTYVLRSAYFFPSLVGLVYVSTIWQAFFQKDTGIINYYLGRIGISPPDWLNSSALSPSTVIIVDVWRNVGFGMLILLAALQDVPKDLVESATVDGAGPWAIFRTVTLPAISPALFFSITMTVIGAFQIYESVVVLTNGGPGDATRSVVMYLAEVGFQKFDMGYASAIAVSLFLIIAVLTGIQFALRRRWVHVD
jgi:multiple sugar transport system permease protein